MPRRTMSRLRHELDVRSDAVTHPAGTAAPARTRRARLAAASAFGAMVKAELGYSPMAAVR